MSRKNEFISKFERNYKLIEDFKVLYQKQLETNGNWDSPAFKDSEITNRQYLNELIRVSDLEYSVKQREAIKTVEIQEHFYNDYIHNLDSQYSSLQTLRDEIIFKNNNSQISL